MTTTDIQRPEARDHGLAPGLSALTGLDVALSGRLVGGGRFSNRRLSGVSFAPSRDGLSIVAVGWDPDANGIRSYRLDLLLGIVPFVGEALDADRLRALTAEATANLRRRHEAERLARAGKDPTAPRGGANAGQKSQARSEEGRG